MSIKSSIIAGGGSKNEPFDYYPTPPDATKASGVGVTLMRNGKILATGENVSLGTVNKSKVPLGLSATYGQTGNKVSAGTVQSVIGVTFIYE